MSADEVSDALLGFLPNDLAEWIRSEATQLSITPSEVVVGALTNYRDSIEWYFSSRGRTRPMMANERHQFSTSENAELDEVWPPTAGKGET